MSIKNQIYFTKDLALTALDMMDKSKYHLFSHDKETADGKKYFYLFDYDQICMRINNHKKVHYYENYDDVTPIKFFLDVDYKLDDSFEKNKYFGYDNINNLITVIVDIFDKIFSANGYTNNQIIVQTATTNSKMSFHIIFHSIIFESARYIKNFMKNIKNELIETLIEEKIIDLSVYRTGCFRLLGCSKIAKDNKLVLHQTINYQYTDFEHVFMDSLLLNVDNCTKIYKYEIIENNKVDVMKNDKLNSLHIISRIPTKKSETINVHKIITSLEELTILLSHINKKRADDYNDWISIGTSLYNSNPNSFDLWVDF